MRKSDSEGHTGVVYRLIKLDPDKLRLSSVDTFGSFYSVWTFASVSDHMGAVCLFSPLGIS